jgi:hypothetical protein
MDDQFQAIFAADPLGFQDLEKCDPFFGAFAFTEAPKQDLASVTFRPNAHGNDDRHFESPFDRAFTTFTVATDFPIGAQESDPNSVNLEDRRYILCLTVRIKALEQMQSFIQRSQRQRADVKMSEQFTHLSQAHGQTTQALELSIYVITDALMRSNLPAKIDLHTTAVLASHTRLPIPFSLSHHDGASDRIEIGCL